MTAPVFGDLRHVTFAGPPDPMLGKIGQVESLRHLIKEIRDEISDREYEIDSLEAQAGRLSRENEAAEGEIESAEEAIAELLAAASSPPHAFVWQVPPYGTTCVPQVPDWWETVGGAV